MKDVTHLFSSTQDKYIAQHMAFAKWCGETPAVADRLRHVVRISCFGADTNTNAYDPGVHVSRDGAQIPLMLQHYWWSEECFAHAGLGDRLTGVRGNVLHEPPLEERTREHQDGRNLRLAPSATVRTVSCRATTWVRRR